MLTNLVEQFESVIARTSIITPIGLVSQARGYAIESDGPDAAMGELCTITSHNQQPISAQVIGFNNGKLTLMPFGQTTGIRLGSRVTAQGTFPSIIVSDSLIGCTINGAGEPLDKSTKVEIGSNKSLEGSSQNPLNRKLINERLETGLPLIDIFLPLGKGQRIGLFAGSGVGKSTLLGKITQTQLADIIVIALIGERGREVNEFIYHTLTEEQRKRAIIVVATADEPPIMKIMAANAAMSIAEYFCAKGKDVLLAMDSITRLAMAQRELGLIVGEPPTSRGYTPSSFATIAKLAERAGNFKEQGTITSIFSVLVEGDDHNEPVADHVRSILDGHIVLSREIANKNLHPSINLLQSVSRLYTRLTSDYEQTLINRLRKYLAEYNQISEMIELGAYEKGKNPEHDQIISLYKKLEPVLYTDKYAQRSNVLKMISNWL
ncbi:FliI/YscN family ATPase [Zooshikella harenae]|uniref:protein-secreting ATPase n=1 Tax=Zooshikella harenae TaxID=2827238 RepID=A0ABS5ZC81_9GAMM|nr:FliI/YscN family ATPase [Zooshikella harenae]MBU2711662.1 FliI/YscN family ATPase [Zooshikella harenae]